MDDGNLLIAAMRTPVDHSTSQRVLDDEPEIEPAPVNPLGWPLGPLGPECGASARSGSAVTAATTFRTDASYLPELHAYLDDLLRTRGRRLLATTDLDKWAGAEAMPSEEEIRRLIEGL